MGKKKKKKTTSIAMQVDHLVTHRGLAKAKFIKYSLSDSTLLSFHSN